MSTESADGEEWEELLRKQRKVLIENRAEFVCTHRFHQRIDAASKADDINNDRDADWDPAYFRATYTRKRIGEYYEVLVRVSPGTDFSALREIFSQEGVRQIKRPMEPIKTPPPQGMDLRLLDFRDELGGDGVATRAVNALYRWKKIQSVDRLREVFQELGEPEFFQLVSQLRNVGVAALERIMQTAKEDG